MGGSSQGRRPVAAGLGLLLVLATAACDAGGSDGTAPPGTEPCPGAELSAGWDRFVAPYLADELWRPDYAYDAGHYLQVPLHAAFALDRADWQEAFADHFRRYLDSGADSGADSGTGSGPERIDNPLSRFQYLYLASRFLVLAHAYDRDELIPPDLPAALGREIDRTWRVEPARHWSRDRKRRGLPMGDLLRWKLDVRDVEPGYLRALRDEELFALMVAADLERFRRATGTAALDGALLGEILRTTDRVFSQEVQWVRDGRGWLLQPGVWSDHRDYRYAGHDALAPDLEPAPVPGLSMDSAHRHRLPLWIVSLAGAHAEGTDGHRHAIELWRGLERQLMEVVLVPPSADFPAYRTNNFMDGSNGVYRYGYETLGPSTGYGPYERSGKLRFGWWRFLPGERVYRLYRALCAQYPLPDRVERLYAGPGTSRPRHPIITRDDAGFQELLVRLAAQLTPELVEAQARARAGTG